MKKKEFKLSKKQAEKYLELLDRFREQLYADLPPAIPHDHMERFGLPGYVPHMPTYTWRTPFEKWYLSEHNAAMLKYFPECFKYTLGKLKFIGLMPIRTDIQVLPQEQK